MKSIESVFGTPHPVALVTGSAKNGRVGNYVARWLAEEGYQVVLHGNSSGAEGQQVADELNARGASATCLEADFAQPDCLSQFVRAAFEWNQRLDVLVNTAAIWDPLPFAEVSAADLEKHWRINTLATFLNCQAAGLLMADQPHGGAIINVGDWATVRPYHGYAAYFPSKAAIEGMTRDLAVELARLNPAIRVNAILPGTVTLPTDLSAKDHEMALNEQLLRREGHPDHIAQAVSALIANDFITGVSLPVDGGRTIHVGGEGQWRGK